MAVHGLKVNYNGIMDDDEFEEESDIGSMSSLSCGGDENSSNSVASEEEMKDEATSMISSLSSSSSSFSINDNSLEEEGQFLEMSSIMSILPIKRGLSKHYDGKSQSFTSFSDVNALEDLVKPENPYKKRLKSSKSYAGGLDGFNPLSPKASSRTIKKSSKSSFSSLSSRRHSFLAGKPPIPPQKSTGSLSGQTLLFA